jgi:hypothetical protein
MPPRLEKSDLSTLEALASGGGRGMDQETLHR